MEYTLEPAAARNLRDFVAGYRLADPSMTAEAVPCAGGWAGFTGKKSPLTTVKGAGPEISAKDIEAAVKFFAAHGAPAAIFELAPWVSAESVQRLLRDGLVPAGEEVVVYRELRCDVQDIRLPVVEMPPEEFAPMMCDTFGFSDELAYRILAKAAALISGAVNLGVPGEDGRWIACAQLVPAGDVAILGCDGTLPAARGRGAQTSLILDRVRRATESGFRFAVAEVAPGSGSERNYLRCGFERAYVRTHYKATLLG